MFFFLNGDLLNPFNVSSAYNRENNHGLAVKSLKKKSYEILVSKPLFARVIFLKFSSLPMNKNDFELNFALGFAATQYTNTIFLRDREIKDSRNVARKFSRNLSPAKIKENKVGSLLQAPR